VGGIKEKVLAAHRNGLKTIILPRRNEFDLDDVPDEIKKKIKFIFVETVDEVLNAALEKGRMKKQPETKQQSKTGEAHQVNA